MHIYREIYELAASAGAMEGYVYQKQQLVPDELTNWVDNLVKAYHALPEEARREFQTGLDQTIGRVVHSLLRGLSEQHDLVKKLKVMTKGPLPKSYDDFNKKKHF